MAIEDFTTAQPVGRTSAALAPVPAKPVPLSTNAQHLTVPRRPDGVDDARIQVPTLYVREGDAFREAPARLVLLQAQELIDQKFHSECWVLGNPQLTRLFLKIHLGGRDHEVFAVLFLDAHRRLIEYVELFRGTVDSAEVHPREVAKEALARNAAAVILVHNHPSGVAEPSLEDERITKRLKAALGLVGVKVIDHLIVGESIASFAELGLL